MKVACLLFLAYVLVGEINTLTSPCKLRSTPHGYVCLCTLQYCDYLDDPRPQGPENFVVVTSSKNGLRFSTTNGQFNAAEKLSIVDYDAMSDSAFHNELYPSIVIVETNDVPENIHTGKRLFSTANSRDPVVGVHVDRGKKYQSINGFGGAFTGSVSHILQHVQQKLQDHIYKSFFHTDGIRFNLLRLSIGGSDFDLQPWAYNEVPRDDVQLTNFTKLDARDELKIEQLNRLKSVAQLAELPKVMAAAWSPPKWMKSNEDWTGFSYLKPAYYQTWADYHLRFLELMAAKNIPIWAISTGNEPLNGVIGWYFVRFMSLGWTPRNQAIWLSEHLGPTLKNSSQRNVLIFSNDDQRYTFPAWFRKMNASRPAALNFLDGLAVHWYWDEIFAPTLTDEALRQLPGKLLINTESCIGDKPWQKHGPVLGSWQRAEEYARDYLRNFQHNYNGWIDWNIVLDERGGPNYVNNFVDAPVIVNTTTGTEFYKQPMFYAIGHFSKFIPEHSARIDAHSSRNDLVEVVAFERPDSSVALIILNSGTAPVDVALNDSLRGNIVIVIPAHTLHTIVYN